MASDCICVSIYFFESNLMTKVALVFGGSIEDDLPLSSGHWKHNEARVCSFFQAYVEWHERYVNVVELDEFGSCQHKPMDKRFALEKNIMLVLMSFACKRLCDSR